MKSCTGNSSNARKIPGRECNNKYHDPPKQAKYYM